MNPALRIIADDLTGACDVAAELLPWPGGVAVVSTPVDARTLAELPRGATVIRNTQSRTLPPSAVRDCIRDAVRDVPRGWRGILLKKIDTGLRGSLGAELEATMAAVGATEAIIAPAIPEVGRTTEGGLQLIGGVPVDQTAFAHDPQNPVRHGRVTEALADTTALASGLIELATVREPGGVARAIETLRGQGVQLIVCDAATDADLEAIVRGVLSRPRPLVLAGSIGLTRALRTVLAVDRGRPILPAIDDAAGRGTLVVIGSAHPTAAAQVRQALTDGEVASATTVRLGSAVECGAVAARELAGGRSTALLPPPAGADSAAVLAAMRDAANTVLDRVRPAGLVLVGGETAYHVLESLGHPALWIESRPFPLVVRSRFMGGPLAGLPLATKGGSSGGAQLLGQLLRQMRCEVRR